MNDTKQLVKNKPKPLITFHIYAFLATGGIILIVNFSKFRYHALINFYDTLRKTLYP